MISAMTFDDLVGIFERHLRQESDDEESRQASLYD
jgi:hypothetical protein